MNVYTDAREYALVIAGFPILDEQPQAASGSTTLVPQSPAREMDSLLLNWLFYLRAILLQVFVISLLVGFSEFARPDLADDTHESVYVSSLRSPVTK